MKSTPTDFDNELIVSVQKASEATLDDFIALFNQNLRVLDKALQPNKQITKTEVF